MFYLTTDWSMAPLHGNKPLHRNKFNFDSDETKIEPSNSNSIAMSVLNSYLSVLLANNSPASVWSTIVSSFKFLDREKHGTQYELAS